MNFADVPASDGGEAYVLIGAPGSIHWSGETWILFCCQDLA